MSANSSSGGDLWISFHFFLSILVCILLSTDQVFRNISGRNLWKKMQDYWVVIIAVFCAVALLAILFLGLCLYIRMSRKKMKQKVVLRQQPSRIHPHIPGPIYSITGNSSPVGSIEKEVKPSDTITTRKLSMMFDSKKRQSSAFSQRTASSYFENSPAPKHKEYLDFNDIEKILPSIQKQTLSQKPPPTRISIIEERPFAGHELEPVREVYAENHMSFRRERPGKG